MKLRTAFILRRALLALAIIPGAWLIAFASGVGALVAREQLHVGNAQGSTVIWSIYSRRRHLRSV